ncbi:MAG TPA: hypothetical protein VN366_05010 [Feifaniaceae bacterium]|nr:hypothetical protein [Feifaniaceae bacterium]
MKKLAFLVLAFLLLLPGCVRQQPVLVGEPTPAPTPTPAPSPAAQEIVNEPWPKDAAGALIYDKDNHFERYLTFTDIRVFEYEGGTLMEGVCENAYPKALAGSYEVVFTDKDGAEIARADVLTRGEADTFPPGKTVVYAAIDTDMDILMMEFTLAPKQPVGEKAA